jgi:hypothetical protein
MILHGIASAIADACMLARLDEAIADCDGEH